MNRITVLVAALFVSAAAHAGQYETVEQGDWIRLKSSPMVTREMADFLPISSDTCSFVEQVIVNHTAIELSDMASILFLGIDKGITRTEMAVDDCYKRGYIGIQGDTPFADYSHRQMYTDIESFRDRTLNALKKVGTRK